MADAIDPDLIVLGDTNIEKIGDPYYKALKSGGLIIPEEVQATATNLTRDKHFDQIAYHKYKDSTIVFSKAGTVDFTKSVFKELTLKKKSYEMTDHLPLWSEFQVSPDKGDPQSWLNP